MRKIYPTTIEAIEAPTLIRITDNFYVVAFRLMKLLPAHFILDRAQQAGLLDIGSIIIETSSGTFGLALAMICALRGYRLILVSDPVIDTSLKRRLEELGAHVEIVSGVEAYTGIQQVRLDRIKSLQEEHPGYFWPSQYDNPHNPEAYTPVAELLVEALGHVDCLIGTVGSGGSLCGTSNYLRMLFPQLTVAGVDTHGSVLFGLPDQPRLLRGLGNSLMPKNVAHMAFDEIHWVNAAEAFLATRILHRTHALYMGGTSGAAFLVSRWWAQQHPNATVVALLPDEGYRYQDTIYNDDWLRQHNALLTQLPEQPCLVSHPHEVNENWSYMLWKRRTYEQVLHYPFLGGQSRGQ
ncbi:MAG: cysteine synthase family protein [Chloroflexi bacterium]|nr:cysteine synthase family protein [Ktedonobacteraceae bacterium]MBV9019248.1 cysteine synthase family protein [Ktedonobacteraceae bacterium]MBV9706175.1 cysteine synthase family protein [Chloroflexota bacterium]